LVALFRGSFAPRASVFQPCSNAGWRWKYHENPCGSASLIARVDGAAVAHVGGVLGTFWRGVERRSTVQATDHMVHPRWRDGVVAAGLFVRLMDAWIERYCGPHASSLAWGFPSTRDFEIGRRRLRHPYESLGPVEVLVGPIVPVHAGPAGLAASRRRASDEELDELWSRCRASLPMTMDRGAAFLRWRYERHPARRYRFVSVRDAGGVLRGVCLLRGGGLLASDTALLLEWLVDADDEEAERSLLAASGAVAHGEGCDSLAVWLAPWQRGTQRIRRLGYRAVPTTLRHAARSWDPHTTLADLREGCAWSLGDVDFL